MAQTPISASIEVLKGTQTLYTVPAGKTAVIKGVVGGSVTGNASATYTVNKVSGGVSFPLAVLQTSTLTPATGGTTVQSTNLLQSPVTLSAGESVSIYTAANNSIQIPNISTLTNSSGETWDIYQITYQNNIFMAVGRIQSSSSFVCLTSADAVTWTRQSVSPLLKSVNCVVYGGGYWVAVPFSGYDNRKVYYSSDNGVSWTSITVSPDDVTATSVAYNGTTWVLAFKAVRELYTASNPTAWTQNSNWVNYVYSTSSSNSEALVAWSGTDWIITFRRGAIVYTPDFVTFTSLGTVFLGQNVVSANIGPISYSSAYSKWYTMVRITNANNTVFSSTDGQNWTQLVNPVYNANWGIEAAGSNPVLLANNSQQSSGAFAHLKSTDGVTWAYATDSRSFTGGLFGFPNGYFVKFNINTQAQYYISTDPTTDAGILQGATSGFSQISSCGASAPAGVSGGKWIVFGVGPSGTDLFAVGGATATTAGAPTSLGYTVANYGFPRCAYYNPVDDYFYMITQFGYVFQCQFHNGGTSNVGQVISGADADYQMEYFNGFIYASCDSGSGDSANYSFIAPATNPLAFNGYITSSIGYPNYGSTNNISTGFRMKRFSGSPTRLLSLNTYNSVSVYDSTDPLTLKFYPIGPYHYQKLNGTDLLYGGVNAINGAQIGVFQSSNMKTTLPTGSLLNQIIGGTGTSYWSKNNYIAYINSKYYIPTDSGLFIGATLPSAVGVGVSGTSVNGELWASVSGATEVINSGGTGGYFLSQQTVGNTGNLQVGYTTNIDNSVNNSVMTGSIVQID